jgi:hypothetical protein
VRWRRSYECCRLTPAASVIPFQVLQVNARCLRRPAPNVMDSIQVLQIRRRKLFGDGLMEVGGGVEEAASIGGSSWGWTDGGGRRRGGGSIDGGSIDGERDRVNLIIWAGLGSGLVLILSLRRYMGWASMGRQHRCSFLLLHQINFIFLKYIYIKTYLRIGFFYKIRIAVSVSAGYRYTYLYPCCVARHYASLIWH